MKILIVQAHQSRLLAEMICPPLGITCLASYLRTHAKGSHEIRLIDMGLDHLSTEEVVRRAKAFAPDFIGISARTAEAEVMHALSGQLKEGCPHARIVAGGPHPTAIPQAVLTDQAIDGAVAGEGEVTLTELVDRLDQGEGWEGVAGFAYRQGGQMVKGPPRQLIPDLDALPYPAWDLLDLPGYWDSKRSTAGIPACKPYVIAMTSRGCPYHCIYCHRIFGKTFRKRSPQSVLEEIAWTHRTFGVGEFHIWDDCFNLDRERALAIFRGIKKLDLDLRFVFLNALRSDILDEELIQALKEGGTYFVCVAVETASPRLQKLIKKNVNLDRVRENIRLLSKARIFSHGYFMLGFPTETLEEMETTIDFAVHSQLNGAAFFRTMPFPGTELHDKVRGAADDDRRDWTEFRILDWRFSETTNCSEVPVEKINELQKRAWRRFYLNPVRAWRSLWRLPPVLIFRMLKRHILFNIAYRKRRKLWGGPIAPTDLPPEHEAAIPRF